MNLAQLIKERQRDLGDVSLRDLERRAAERGHKVSASSLSAYATGKRTALPELSTRESLAAALGVSVEAVTQAAVESAAPEVLDDDGRAAQHATAWLVLTEGRTEQEIRHLLAVARQVLAGMDAVRGREDGTDDHAADH